MDSHVASVKQTALRGLVCVASVLFSFLSWNCFDKPLEPVMPTWNVDLTLPLSNRTYSLDEIVRKDSNMLRVGAGGQIIYMASASTAPTAIGDLISLSPADTSAYINFGVFSVAAPPVILPMDIPWLPDGGTIPLPDTTVSFPSAGLNIPTFQSVTFASGQVTLALRNNLPVPISVLEPVHLVDSQSRLIATFVFNPPTIPAFDEAAASDILDDKTTTNQLVVSGLVIHTSGTQSPVPIPVSDCIVATLTPSNLKARRAVLAEIPPQRLANNDTAAIVLDDSTLVQDVLLHSGNLGFSFQSRVSLPILFKFRIAELLKHSGGAYAAYEDSILLPAQGTGSFGLNLAGWRIRSTTGDLVRSLQVTSSVVIPQGSGQPVTVNDTDKVQITLSTIAPLQIDTAVAVIKPTWVDVHEAVAMNFGELPHHFSGHLNIPLAALNLGTDLTFGFPTDLYLSIAARNAGTGQWVYLQIPSAQKRIQPGATTITFNESAVGQFLSQFSGSLPDTLHVMGQVHVNPPEVYNPTLAGVGGVGRNSTFRGRVDLEVPLLVGIANGSYRDTLVIGDTTGDGNRDFSIDKNRLREVNHGKLFIEVENAIPMQIGLELDLLERAGYRLLHLPHAGSTINIGAATVDATGNVTVPRTSRVTLELSSNDVRQFDPAEFISYAVSLTTTPGSSAVRFRTTDYVRIRVWSTLSYKVNG